MQASVHAAASLSLSPGFLALPSENYELQLMHASQLQGNAGQVEPQARCVLAAINATPGHLSEISDDSHTGAFESRRNLGEIWALPTRIDLPQTCNGGGKVKKGLAGDRRSCYLFGFYRGAEV